VGEVGYSRHRRSEDELLRCFDAHALQSARVLRNGQCRVVRQQEEAHVDRIQEGKELLAARDSFVTVVEDSIHVDDCMSNLCQFHGFVPGLARDHVQVEASDCVVKKRS